MAAEPRLCVEATPVQFAVSSIGSLCGIGFVRPSAPLVRDRTWVAFDVTAWMCELRNVTKLEVGYRALPSEVPHPKKARRISKEAFHERRTVMLQSVDGICAGHLGTEVWHDGSCFLVLVKLEGRDDVVAESICTFTPTFGMDAIDGLFAEDVEDWILHEELGRTSERAGVFDNVDAIAVQTYLSERGFNTEPDQDQQTAVRKWWQFWK